ncbi:hypothetical protein [Sanguibacter sp. 25GB23B1]|uniref:hypothetical protein n=1 Tax=unclassified Sanguibacter TaxID=2645534 RepID=UPI0032AE94AA
MHTLLFAALITAFVWLLSPEREKAVALVGLSGDVWALVLVVLVVLVSFAVMGADAESVVAWEMYAVGGVVALVENLRAGLWVEVAVSGAVFLWVVAYFWRKVRLTRRARWRRLSQVLDNHELVEAEVVRHRWLDKPGSNALHEVRLVLATALVPGQQWNVQLVVPTRQVDAAPETGDRVLMFVCPADPEVAVVRPVLPA